MSGEFELEMLTDDRRPKTDAGDVSRKDAKDAKVGERKLTTKHTKNA